MADTASIYDSLREVNPRLILAAGSFDDDTHFVRELMARDIRPETIGAVAAGISAFGEQLGEAASGVFGPSQWEPYPEFIPDYGPSPAAVVDMFEATDVQATNYPAAQAFATGIIIEACLGANDAYNPAAGTIDQRRLSIAVETSDFTTFYGRFRIDPETGKQVGHTPVIVQ